MTIIITLLHVFSLWFLVQGRQIQVTNKDGGDVWIGCKGNAGKAHLGFGGFVLSSGETRTLDAADDWSGHFWARTWCDTNNNHCLTGDCGNKISCSSADFTPPVTTVELSFGDTDYYAISLVNGFNILAEVSAVGVAGCSTASCQSRINSECPDELKVDTEHGVLACKSACVAFDTDQYCCRNDYASSDSCDASSWPNSYGTFFSDRCSDALLTPYDQHAVHSCKADVYEIKFGG